MGAVCLDQAWLIRWRDELNHALEPFLAKSRGTFDLKDFYPGAIDYFRWDGKLWALPNYSGPGVYYYNTALLRQRGLEDPWELFQKGQWTIQKMDEAPETYSSR